MEKDEYVLIKAKVLRRQDGVVTVNLEDGFGRTECPIHEASIIPAK